MEMQTSIEHQLLATLKAIEEHVKEKPFIPRDKIRWNSRACAIYMNLSSSKYFLQNIACIPSFPDPIKPKLGSGKRGKPLWLATDVIKWLESQK